MANDAPIALTILANDERVHYDDSWYAKPNSTSFFTTKANAIASLTFNGTLIQAYGVTGIGGAQATFLLDCIEVPTPPLSPSDSSIPLFNPGLQSDDEHQLTIRTMNDSLEFTLDSFLITTHPSKEITGRDIPTFKSCAAPIRLGSSEKAPTSISKKHGLHPGVIAGIIIGVAAFLAVVIFLVIFLRRRSRYPKRISTAEKGFNIIELEPMDGKKSLLYDLFAFKRRPTGSTPPVSNTRSHSTGIFSSVIMIPPFYTSTTSGSIPDAEGHPRQ